MSGTDTITVTVSDSEGASTTESFVVGVDLANDTPTLSSIDDLTVKEDTSEIIVSLNGITDGDEYREQELTVTALHTNIDLVTGIDVEYISPEEAGFLTLTIASELSGIDTVIVQVTDNEGATLTDTFVVTVIPANDAPYLSNPVPDFNINAGGLLDVVISSEFGEIFNDIDDTSLRLTILMEDESELPDWIDIDIFGTEYVLNGTPLLQDTGCVNILVQAFDNEGAMATDTFMLCVDGYPVNIKEIVAGKFELKMYPNPTKGMVTVETSVLQTTEIEVAVMNIAGAEVFRKKYQSTDPIQFDLSNHVSGLYMVLINVGGQRLVKKLILDRE
jgi:hypothetical protein